MGQLTIDDSLADRLKRLEDQVDSMSVKLGGEPLSYSMLLERYTNLKMRYEKLQTQYKLLQDQVYSGITSHDGHDNGGAYRV